LDSNSPANSFQQPGAVSIAVLEVQVNNPASIAATLTGMTLTAAGNGLDDVGITGVRVFLDTNEDGIADGNEPLLGSGSYPTNNGSAVIAFNLVLGAGETVHLMVLEDFSATAPNGTYQANLNAGGLSGTSESGAAQFTGLPSTGAIISIAHPTETPTDTNTTVPSFTPSATPTGTWTPLFTATRTTTPVPTATSIPTSTRTGTPSFTPTITQTASVTSTFTYTSTITPTFTDTVQPGLDQPVIHPNPCDGTQPVSVLVPGRSGESAVTVSIFTVAFRKVQEKTVSRVLLGTDVGIDLKDMGGTPLASGLYYVVVVSNQGRSVGKLLILR
jgi:hypothetical protein